jgi:KipI family sensor histidine kinase inhibitor
MPCRNPEFANRQIVVIRDAGDAAILLELDAVIDPKVNAHAIDIAATVRAEGIRGVRDVVSTFRSVAVYFDPLMTDAPAVRASLQRAMSSAGGVRGGHHVEVRVAYGGEFGPDLEAVAAFAGLTPAQVIDRHAAAEYRVFMLGFLPGFAYMGIVPPEIVAPRKDVPRLRVPGGSVGIAGRQTAIYPRDSPGGWQIIGRASLLLFDHARTPPSLFAPGDTVTFIPSPVDSIGLAPHATPTGVVANAGDDIVSNVSRMVTVLSPGLFTTIQDAGRWGYQGIGVPVSGAMDLVSHRAANAIVGNPPDAATLESTLLGPALRFEQQTTVAVTGGDLSATLDGAPIPLGTPIRSRAGAVLRFGERRHGTRAYVACDGGIAVAPVLGSRSTHAVSAMGGLDGRAVRAGDRLPLGPAAAGSLHPVGPATRQAAGGVRVRVLPGPQDDYFNDAAFEALQRCRFSVSSKSDRMGFRLQGGHIPREPGREMISDATFAGAVQVPPSGEPILLMADRQTTGGYPQIATVITADLPDAAQLAPGDWIEFEICSRADARAALVAQEGRLRAVG